VALPFVPPSPIGNSQKSLSQERDRWFESGSLQRQRRYGAGGGEMDIAGWFHGNEPAADSTTEALGPGSYRDDVDGGRAMRFAGCGR